MDRLNTIFLHTGERPHQIHYVCPMCDSGNYVMLPESTAKLSCHVCGGLLDGSAAEILVIPVKITAPTWGQRDFSK